MKKIVVNIQPSLDNDCPSYFVEADGIDRATKKLILSDIAPFEGPQNILKLGEALAKKLTDHERIKDALDIALAIRPGDPSWPIYFFIGVDTAVPLSWEALREKKQYLALDPRWPIARFPRGGDSDAPIERPFAPPLRVVSVISALDVNGTPEWDSVFGAVRAAPAGLGIELTVITGDERVVTAARQHLPPERVILLPGPGDPTPLEDRIAALEPHILHIFCHGTVSAGQSMLEFATVSDFDRGKSSVIVPAMDIAHAVAKQRTGTWMVHLNSCSTAEASGELLTHAEDLVNTGIPVAVGMKRLINPDDAFGFTASFYRSVFERIADIVASGAGRHEIVWAETLLNARKKLRNMHADDHAEADAWTVPVMYTKRGAFTLDVAAAGVSEAQVQQVIGEASVVDGLVELIRADAPEVAADLEAVNEQ